MSSFLSPLLQNAAALYVLRNARTGATLATKLEVAFDSKSRNRGLLGRDRLDEGSAMILAPCSSIHTFFMRFAIDVVFVAKDGRVVKTASNVRPWHLALGFGAFATIELPAGTFAVADVRRDDSLILTRQ